MWLAIFSKLVVILSQKLKEFEHQSEISNSGKHSVSVYWFIKQHKYTSKIAIVPHNKALQCTSVAH